MSDLEGIPWTVPMELLFEAWVETVLRAVAIRTGGRLRSGRKRETVSPLAWEPPYLGSQKSLVPDLVFELEGCTLVLHAKYKRHWEKLRYGRWSAKEDILHEEHRQDLLQILAYANLADAPLVVCCLVYPCSTATGGVTTATTPPLPQGRDVGTVSPNSGLADRRRNRPDSRSACR